MKKITTNTWFGILFGVALIAFVFGYSRESKKPTGSTRIELTEFQKDSMARANVDAMLKDMKSKRKVLEWRGFHDNNVIFLVETENQETPMSALSYARKTFKQDKPYQNLYIYFYRNNAPKNINAPEYTEGGLYPAFKAIKKSKPYLTVMVIGESEYDSYSGFYGI